MADSCQRKRGPREFGLHLTFRVNDSQTGHDGADPRYPKRPKNSPPLPLSCRSRTVRLAAGSTRSPSLHGLAGSGTSRGGGGSWTTWLHGRNACATSQSWRFAAQPRPDQRKSSSASSLPHQQDRGVVLHDGVVERASATNRPRWSGPTRPRSWPSARVHARRGSKPRSKHLLERHQPKQSTACHAGRPA